MSSFRAACVQLCSSDDVEENVRIASDLIRGAKSKRARFIATPANTRRVEPDGGAKRENCYSEETDPGLPRLRTLAEEYGMWLLIGSLPIKTSERRTSNWS